MLLQNHILRIIRIRNIVFALVFDF